MSKYSQKIKSFVKNDNPYIRYDKKQHISINNIYHSIVQSMNKKHTYVLQDNSIIKPIHNKNEYPLIYIYFSNLKKSEILDKIMKYIPDITDFMTFVNWYREHINHIDYDIIREHIESTPVNQELADVYRLMFKTQGHRAVLHKMLYNNKFIGLDVQHNIESSELIYSKYLIDNKHNVEMFVPNTNTGTGTDKGTYKDKDQGPDIDIIAKIIDSMDQLSKKYNNNIPTVNLTVIYSDQKKSIHISSSLGKLCESESLLDYYHNKILSNDNINSGSTYPGHSITCWRREEFYKVLIHELFHYHGFDFFNTDSHYEHLEKNLQIPDIDGIDMLNECYTESVSILIFSIFLSIYDSMRVSDSINDTMRVSDSINDTVRVSDTENTKITYEGIIDKSIKNDISREKLDHYNNQLVDNMSNEIMEKFLKILKIETSFVIFQVAKVIYMFGGESFDDFFKNKITIKQCTSFRSYFILKMILLLNLQDLVDFMDQGLIVQDKRLLDLGDLINRSMENFKKNDNNVSIINNYIKILDQSNETNDKWIYNTFRMSAHDIC